MTKTPRAGENWKSGRRCLLSAAFDHLREEEDAIQVDKLLGEGDVPGEAGQVLQGFQLGIHARRLNAFVELLGVLSLTGRKQREEDSRREPQRTGNPRFGH